MTGTRDGEPGRVGTSSGAGGSGAGGLGSGGRGDRTTGAVHPRAVGTRHRVTVRAVDTTAVPMLRSRRPSTVPTIRPVLRSSALTTPLVATDTTASATRPEPIGQAPAESRSTRPASKPVTHRSSATDGGAGAASGGLAGRSTAPCRSPASVRRRDRSTMSPSTSSPRTGSSPSASARSPIVADGSASTTTSRHVTPATASANGSRPSVHARAAAHRPGSGRPASVSEPPPAQCCSRRIASSVPQPSARLTRSSAEPPSPQPGHRHRGRSPVDSSSGGAGSPRWAGDGQGCPSPSRWVDNARTSTPASAITLAAVTVVVVPMSGMCARATADRKAAPPRGR